MADYHRHIILITDGQVNNVENVIQLIGRLKVKNIANTHVIGIGNGVSFDMVKRGAL
jgi:hypothetical protein